MVLGGPRVWIGVCADRLWVQLLPYQWIRPY